jgi:hypothetical protein
MEGTSGAADRVPFREGIREAALHGGGSAKAGLCPASSWRPSSEGHHGAGISMLALERARDREVPEPIGLGISFHHEQSWWEEQPWD